MFDMNNIMGKIKDAQDSLQKAQENLVNITAEGDAGAGMVIVKVNGKKQIIDINIDISILSPNDKEMVQDLTIAATNKALDNIEPKISEELKNSTSDVLPNIPGFDLNNFMGK